MADAIIAKLPTPLVRKQALAQKWKIKGQTV
jgi:hypothetical protein